MKAAFIERAGPPDAVLYGERPLPEPGPREVLVRLEASALNIADLYIRGGRYDAGIPLPYILGRDLVGTVESAGPQVSAFAAGQRVWSCALGLRGRQGTWAEYAVAPEDLLFPLSGEVPTETAAASLHSALTAVVGLEQKAALKAGETIFVTGASGNVGRAVVALAKKAGARVVASAGSPEKAEECRALGADAVLLYREQDPAEALKALAPGGAQVWWEATPEPDLERAFRSLAPNGRLVLITGFSHRADFPLRDFYVRNLTAYGFAASALDDECVRRAAPAISSALADGTLRPKIARVFPFSAAREAHRLLESGPVDGKIVLVPDRVRK